MRGGTTTTKEKSAAVHSFIRNISCPTTCILHLCQSSLRLRHSPRLACLRRATGLVAVGTLHSCSRFCTGHFCCSGGGKRKFSANIFISVILKRSSDRSLTFFLRPAATSTVVMELPPENKLKFHRRGSSSIDCGAFGGRVLKRSEPSKLRQREDKGLAGGAVERGPVLVSASQKSFPCIIVRLAITRKIKIMLTYLAKSLSLLSCCCLET